MNQLHRQIHEENDTERQRMRQAVQSELLQRITQSNAGLLRYQRSHYAQHHVPYPVIWSEGGARLLDVAPQQEGATVLCVPSLINRYPIFDLLPEHSMAAYLAGQGMRPLLLDWGDPNAGQFAWGSAEYVAQLGRAVQSAARQMGGKVTLLGYCMGGNLALASAVTQPGPIRALALLATPWDFHAPDSLLHPDCCGIQAAKLAEALAEQDFVSPEWIQLLFYQLLPFVFLDKFRQFAACDDPKAAEHFVAIEHWVNDGVRMSRTLAQECLTDWVTENVMATGRWRVNGQTIWPEALSMPCFLALPTRDRIVTPGNAGALARHLPQATTCYPDTGHVGMVAGQHARTALWEGLGAWIRL